MLSAPRNVLSESGRSQSPTGSTDIQFHLHGLHETFVQSLPYLEECMLLAAVRVYSGVAVLGTLCPGKIGKIPMKNVGGKIPLFAPCTAGARSSGRGFCPGKRKTLIKKPFCVFPTQNTKSLLSHCCTAACTYFPL